MGRPNTEQARQDVINLLHTKLSNLGISQQSMQEILAYAPYAGPTLEDLRIWHPDEHAFSDIGHMGPKMHNVLASDYTAENLTLGQYLNVFAYKELGDLFTSHTLRQEAEQDDVAGAHYAAAIRKLDAIETEKFGIECPLTKHLDFIREIEECAVTGRKLSADTLINEIELLQSYARLMHDDSVRYSKLARDPQALEAQATQTKIAQLCKELTISQFPLPWNIPEQAREELEKLQALYEQHVNQRQDIPLPKNLSAALDKLFAEDDTHTPTREEMQTAILDAMREILTPIFEAIPQTARDYKIHSESHSKNAKMAEESAQVAAHIIGKIREIAESMDISLDRGRRI